jgi:hypothetical protein
MTPMRSKLSARLFQAIMALLIGLGVLRSTPAFASQATVVSVQPPSGTFMPGMQFTVEVWVENVDSLYGVDIHLSFDPAVLQVVDSDLGNSGTQITPLSSFLSPDFVIRNQADNSAGAVWFAVTQLNPSQPVSGSGALFAVTFEALAPGLAAVDVAELDLSAPLGVHLPASAASAVLEVVEGDLFLPLVLSRN